MLYSQSSKVLKDLRKCQCAKGVYIYVDFDTGETIGTVDGFEIDRSKALKFRFPGPKMILAFEDLLGRGLIKCSSGHWTYICVTMAGNHDKQYALHNFISFMAKSVLVPILVSAATALVTLWIQGAFSSWLSIL